MQASQAITGHRADLASVSCAGFRAPGLPPFAPSGRPAAPPPRPRHYTIAITTSPPLSSINNKQYNYRVPPGPPAGFSARHRHSHRPVRSGNHFNQFQSIYPAPLPAAFACSPGHWPPPYHTCGRTDHSLFTPPLPQRRQYRYFITIHFVMRICRAGPAAGLLLSAGRALRLPGHNSLFYRTTTRLDLLRTFPLV